MSPTRTRPGQALSLFCLGLLLVFPATPAAAHLDWRTYRDDDGTLDSHWGMCGPGQVLRKIVVLENTAAAREAVVHYEMGSDPYHAATRSAHRRPAPGVAWDDWVIRVNGKEAARGSPLDLATRGRHRVKIPAALLKDGENTLDFGWAGTGREGGAAYFYLGIDTRTRAGRSASSANGRDFDSDLLRPAAPPKPEHQGEYMVRLLVGYAAEGAGAEAGDWPLVFADVFNRGGVLGVDFFEGNWVAKRGQWEVAGELKGQGAGALLMNTRPFRLPLRIEYECASDNPGDLSLQLNSPIDKPFCFVGFGSEYNTKNKIVTAAGEELAVSKTGLIEPGRVHTVVVEAAERSIRQLVDGTETAAAALAMPRRAVFFGFYVWNPGAIRGVKVYSPAGLEPDPPAATEPEPSVRVLESFGDWPIGALDGRRGAVSAGGARIADVPTWIYYNALSEFRSYRENEDPVEAAERMKQRPNKGSYFVGDPCLELAPAGTGGAARASAQFPVPPMRRGLVEFDLMADGPAGGALRVSLSSKVSLSVDRDGALWWEPGAGRERLASRIQYHGIHGIAKFRIEPRRWYTVRLDYDTGTSLANAAIVNLYSYDYLPKDGVHRYFSLGEDLPLPADAVTNLAFEADGPGRFCVDNVFFISRTPDLEAEDAWRTAARNLMKVPYHLRKDPLSFDSFSLRNVRNQTGSGRPAGDEFQDLLDRPGDYAVLLDSARQYNEALIRLAFLEERLRGLERVFFYASAADAARAAGFAGRMEAARQDVAEARQSQAALYDFYAACYLDGLNQAALQDGFAARLAGVTAKMDESDSRVEALYADLRPASCAEPPGLAARYEPQPDWESLEFAGGAHRRNGRKEFLFLPSQSPLPWLYMTRALLFPNLRTLGVGHLVRDTREPDMSNGAPGTYFHRICTEAADDLLSLRLDYGQHHHYSVLPAWWTDKYGADRDLFLQNARGDIAEVKQHKPDHYAPRQQFNYWNPTVLTAQQRLLESLADALAGYGLDAPRRVINIDMAQEAWMPILTANGLWETGYNPTAVQAFRKRLQAEYGEIGTLNARWGSRYAGFDTIEPPPDIRLAPRPEPTGLAYEFERFRMRSWSDWLKACHAWLQARLPHPASASCDVSYPMLSCQDAVDGFDTVALFETFPVVMDHYQQQFADDPAVYRYLENLRQVFGTSTGCGEWYVAGPDEVFHEQACLYNGLRQCAQFVQWGRNMIAYWGGSEFYWLTGGNWTEGRLGHTIFRYSAAYVPLSIARARAHQAVYLECPLAQPDVGLIESDTSYYHVSNVRGGLSEFAGLLFAQGHDFGFLFERLIREGRQPLDPYRALILPNAPALPAAFARRLLAWVEQGGTLIATGPVGAWDEYGRPNGLLLDAALGPSNWTREGRALRLRDGLADTETRTVEVRSPAAFLVERRLGKGAVIIRQGAFPPERLYRAVAAAAPRRFYGENNRFHLVLRQDKTGVAGKPGSLYLSVLNPDCHRPREDELVVAGAYRDIADISCGFPIPSSIRDGQTRFSIRLGPAETAMIRIRP